MCCSRFCASSCSRRLSSALMAACCASRALRWSSAACLRAAASASCCEYCCRRLSMWSSISMLRPCSFFMLFWVRWSSSRSHASIFSCFMRSCVARSAAFSRRYSFFFSSFSCFSLAMRSICCWRYSRYSPSACFSRCSRSSIRASRLASSACSASFFWAWSAAWAASSSTFRFRASSSILALASCLARSVSMMSWMDARSLALRSASRMRMRSSRFTSFSW
mmetsp:Transcript_56918/g.182939  ORF Transcript_56918/g.182939 Transcript_56918/m.182939 type:complete len:222 (+) Transcript_56918:497-1162(+)